MLSPHEFQERERIAEERDDAAERFARFAPIKRDWWQAREEDGMSTLSEEIANHSQEIQPCDGDTDGDGLTELSGVACTASHSTESDEASGP